MSTTKADKEDRRHSREKRPKKSRRDRSHKRKESRKKSRHDQDQISSSSSSSSLEEEIKDRHPRSDDGGTSGEERYRHRHRHHRPRHRRSRSERKHDKKKRRKICVSSDDDSDSSGSRSGNDERNLPRQRRLKKQKKHRKKSKHSDRGHHRSDSSRKCPDLQEPALSKKSLQFASTLQSLLQYHPALSKELPYLLIRLAGGSGLNLRSMINAHASNTLTEVFKSMGCTLNSTTDCWEWKGGEGLKGLLNADDESLLLVKMAKCLLDEVGVTMEAVHDFEKVTSNEVLVQDTANATKSITATGEEKEDTQTGEIALLTTMLLDKFNNIHHNTGNISKSSLAKEVFDVVTMISDGESICLDAIPDDNLRKSLETLFLAVGLTKEEMMEEEEEEGKGENNELDEIEKVEGGSSIAYGYTLPEELTPDANALVKTKLHAVISACKFRHQNIIQSKSKRRVLGPAMPLPSNPLPSTDRTVESDTDDDDGPVPLGSKRIARGIGSSVSPHTAKLMAKEQATTSKRKGDEGGRESWMLEPGEHDFLKGIMASGTIKNRKFQNIKTQGRYDKASTPADSMPLDPKVQLEVNDILKAHAQARGPSLIDQHRENKMKQDADASGGGDTWGWSRDKDLDRDRRVDKQHLSLVLGGASQELKDKFQGGFSKSFM